MAYMKFSPTRTATGHTRSFYSDRTHTVAKSLDSALRARSLDSVPKTRIDLPADRVSTASTNSSIAESGTPPSVGRQLPQIKFFDVKCESSLPPPSKLGRASSKIRPETARETDTKTKTGLPVVEKQQHPYAPPLATDAPNERRPRALLAAGQSPDEAFLKPPRREYMRIYYSDFLSQKPAEKPVYAGQYTCHSFCVQPTIALFWVFSRCVASQRSRLNGSHSSSSGDNGHLWARWR